MLFQRGQPWTADSALKTITTSKARPSTSRINEGRPAFHPRNRRLPKKGLLHDFHHLASMAEPVVSQGAAAGPASEPAPLIGVAGAARNAGSARLLERIQQQSAAHRYLHGGCPAHG